VKNVYENLVVFGLIGLFAGGTARLFHPDRQPTGVLLTLLQGMVGSMLGGLLSRQYWPEAEGRFASGALLMSLLGAVVFLVFWPGLAYVRGLAAPKDSLR
jgi:uncharacterized membrane protein YeaQ/YmgE (transglycosylase-associated protein family)